MIIPECIIKFSSHLYIHKLPMFCLYNPKIHKLKGYDIRSILNSIKTGDILFRKFDGYLTSMLVPGFWSHTGLYVGNNKVIHAMGEGVICEDILDFLRTDHVSLTRLRNIEQYDLSNVIDRAYRYTEEKIQYDYDFESNNNKFYCTELINDLFDNIFSFLNKNVLGKNSITPDDIYNDRTHLEIITEIRK